MSIILREYRCLCLTVLMAIVCGQNRSNIEPTRYDLIHYLLDNRRYDPSLPPDFYTENITTVSLGLYIYDLNSESDMNMELECTFYLMMKWTDKRLDFSENISSYDSLSLGDETVDKIWIPDLYFHHERKAEMHGLFTKNQLVKVHRNGSIYYSSRFNMKTHCDMDLTHYPFDRQTCPIRIQSYSSSTDYLLLSWNGDDGLMITETDKLKTIEKSQKHTFKYLFPGGNFSTLSAEIIFTRHSQSFKLMYIAPPIIFFTLSLTSFLLGDNIATRITIPIGVLTQLVIQWVGIYNKLPAITTVTRFDKWMLGNLIAVGIVLVINAIICHFKIEQKKEQEKRKDIKAMATLAGRGERQTNRKERIPNEDQVEIEQRSRQFVTGSTTRKQIETKQSEFFTEESPLNTDAVVSYFALQNLESEENKDTAALIGSAHDSDNRNVAVAIEKQESGMPEENESRGNDTGTDSASQDKELEQDFKKRVKGYKETSKWYKEHILEKRKKEFNSLLAEETSIFNGWERAKKKIDHDPRYFLLDENVRQECFKCYRMKRFFVEWFSMKISIILFLVYIIWARSFYNDYWVQNTLR